jgi:UDP-galactose transporter B1
MDKIENPKIKNDKNPELKKEESNENITKFIYILFLYTFFILAGIYEEKIYKNTYSYINNETGETVKSKFHSPTIALFITSISSLIFSSIGYTIQINKLKDKTVNPFTFIDRIILGTLYILSQLTAQSSLQFLDFIIKVIGKSCKSASMMIVNILYSLPGIGFLFNKLLNVKNNKSKIEITLNDIFKVSLTTGSVLLFNLSGKKKSEDNIKNNDHLPIGIGLLLFSLICDALLGIKEKIIINDIHNNEKFQGYEKVVSWEYMRLFSFISLIFCSTSIINGILFLDYAKIFKFIFASKELLFDLIMHSLLASLGQVIIFISLEKYGPLTLSMITSIRKVLSITFSIIVFGKSISFIQTISLLMAITVIFMEIFDKQKNKKKKD